MFSLDATPVLMPGLAPFWDAQPTLSALLVFLSSGLLATLYFLPAFLLTGLLVLLSAAIPVLQPLYHRIRRDWSLIALLIYLNYLLAPAISFDPPQGSEPYKMLDALLLAAGAWIYFRRAGSGKRLGVLLIAAFLAQSVVAVGQYFLYTAPGSGFLSMLSWMITHGQIASTMGTLLPLALPACMAFLTPPLSRPALFKRSL